MEQTLNLVKACWAHPGRVVRDTTGKRVVAVNDRVSVREVQGLAQLLLSLAPVDTRQTKFLRQGVVLLAQACTSLSPKSQLTDALSPLLRRQSTLSDGSSVSFLLSELYLLLPQLGFAATAIGLQRHVLAAKVRTKYLR
jgi:hypothetical protein